jgi:hypothetical protein
MFCIPTNLKQNLKLLHCYVMIAKNVAAVHLTKVALYKI